MLHRRVLAAIAAGLILPIAACSGGNQNSSSNTSTTQSSSAAAPPGSTTIAGSTALLPLVKQAAVDYQTQHPDAKISVSGGGSMTGITQAAQKGVDIGDSDVAAPNQPGLVDHQVAVVAFGVVVNPQANVKNLTTKQIRDIFSGKVKNWSEVGGANQEITIINRPRIPARAGSFRKCSADNSRPRADSRKILPARWPRWSPRRPARPRIWQWNTLNRATGSRFHRRRCADRCKRGDREISILVIRAHAYQRPAACIRHNPSTMSKPTMRCSHILHFIPISAMKVKHLAAIRNASREAIVWLWAP